MEIDPKENICKGIILFLMWIFLCEDMFMQHKRKKCKEEDDERHLDNTKMIFEMQKKKHNLLM